MWVAAKRWQRLRQPLIRERVPLWLPIKAKWRKIWRWRGNVRHVWRRVLWRAKWTLNWSARVRVHQVGQRQKRACACKPLKPASHDWNA